MVIIGGGNVAIDAAGPACDWGGKVTIAYRRSREQMPADIEEVEQAEEEGIEFAFLTIPTEIRGEGDVITGLACNKAELIAKPGTDRLAPVPILGKDFVIPADTVISAIGQYVDDSGMTAFDKIRWTRRGTIEVNHASMETSMPGVFAAGDAVSGPATVIEAIGGGAGRRSHPSVFQPYPSAQDAQDPGAKAQTSHDRDDRIRKNAADPAFHAHAQCGPAADHVSAGGAGI